MTGEAPVRRAEIGRLQKKAERQRIVDYRPDFELDVGAIDRLAEWSRSQATRADVERALATPRRDEQDLAALLSPASLAQLERVATASHRLTLRRFGRTMHLFAPLYLSSECVSECTYCGFQVWNRDIVRRTLTPAEVATEVRYLKSLGFRHVLLVAGEHPKHVSADYVAACVRAAAELVPNVSVEVQAWDEDTYRAFAGAGCDGLVVYQETYDPRVYPEHHLKGNKRYFGWRLGAPERAGSARLRRIGLGSLIGLNPDWRFEVLALAAHARYMIRHHWRSEITVALPRLEPAAGFEQPPTIMSDAEFALATAALRLVLPDVGIVLSTREPQRLRDGLVRIGVTHMSAGSRTAPGGYTDPGPAEGQFEISDERTPAEVASTLAAAGYEAVWKDSSPVFREGAQAANQRV